MLNKVNVYKNPDWIKAEITLAETFDHRMISLLRAINHSGSISQAAKQIELSYRCAWLLVEKANTFSSQQLINCSKGGKNGGGACLTSSGKALLALFSRLEEQHSLYLQRVNQCLNGDAFAQSLLEPLNINTRSYNKLFAKVIHLQPNLEDTDIIVQLYGGERVVASLSLDEFEPLNLSIGKTVLLLIGNEDIDIANAFDTSQFSTRNSLHSSIVGLKLLAGAYEVVLRVIGGDTLRTIVTADSVENLKLKPGISIRALFKSCDVILAVKDDGR
ncbi:TOBE domain-containing protein [Methylomonas sp. AM2-LC]|uniref:TOBE domain-containing protein n=1 Tax=Methylomonas sp. AM2-LC TaxID=3153301 RepID=UPI003267C4D0